MASRNGISKYFNDEDFDEGEVWSVTEENSSPKLRKPFKNTFFHSPTSSISAPRMIPRSSSSSSSSSSSCEKQSSAPVEIPDWSKIYGKTIRMKRNGTISTSWVDYNAKYHDGYCGNSGFYYHHHDGNNNNSHQYLKGYCNDDGGVGSDNGDHDDDGRDDDDDDGMIPPHEFLARKLARSQISSFSVCEGIGRTLKGRDLSKVRNAILTKTGFLE